MSHLQHEPSEKTRELVTALALTGVPQRRIAAQFGITEKMLRWPTIRHGERAR
jgi:hypothetical protein